MGMHKPRLMQGAAALLGVLLLAACGGTARPTRTPVPTWTPTVGAPPLAAQAAQSAPGEPVAQVAQATQAASAAQPVQAVADTLAPPTAAPPTLAPPADTPTPLPTLPPTDTPTPPPTVAPTDTPTPVPTATPNYAFALEAAEKFPTEALAPNVVRIWLYVYSPAELGLGGYTLRVLHNGAPLTVEETSLEGVPAATRSTPGPYMRFTNLNVLFVEPQAGEWEVQLVDAAGAPVGPPARFTLSADEVTRELYVRYKQVAPVP